MLQLVTRGMDVDAAAAAQSGSGHGQGSAKEEETWKREGEVSLSGSMTRQVRRVNPQDPLNNICYRGADGYVADGDGPARAGLEFTYREHGPVN